MKDANEKAYQQQVEDSIPRNYSKANINKLEKKLRRGIVKAAKKHIGKKKITAISKPWMTPEIKAAIKERNDLEREIQYAQERMDRGVQESV